MAYFGDLLQKTFKADSQEEIDKLCNDFNKEYKVKATQTNQVFNSETNKIEYFSVLFYLPKNEKQIDLQQMKKEGKFIG